jgi:hypothetical protein
VEAEDVGFFGAKKIAKITRWREKEANGHVG